MYGGGLIKVTKNQIGTFVILVLQVLVIMSVVYLTKDMDITVRLPAIGFSAPAIVYLSLFLIATYLS